MSGVLLPHEASAAERASACSEQGRRLAKARRRDEFLLDAAVERAAGRLEPIPSGFWFGKQVYVHPKVSAASSSSSRAPRPLSIAIGMDETDELHLCDVVLVPDPAETIAGTRMSKERWVAAMRGAYLINVDISQGNGPRGTAVKYKAALATKR